MAFTFKRAASRLAGASLALAACTHAHAQVTAGPGAWSTNQTWAADSVNGGNLTGYFYWPSTQPTLGGKRALVLVLHGCAQTASGDVIDSSSDKGFNWKTVADQYGAVILAPNATGNVSGSHCWDYSAPITAAPRAMRACCSTWSSASSATPSTRSIRSRCM
jgi:poly(3-hydroxybutyrate) depolymerase